MNGEFVNMNGGSYVVTVVPVGRRNGVGSLCWSASSARGIAWLPLPRESPFMLIFYPGLVDPMWNSAYASNMNRRQIEARVQRTQ